MNMRVFVFIELMCKLFCDQYVNSWRIDATYNYIAKYVMLCKVN